MPAISANTPEADRTERSEEGFLTAGFRWRALGSLSAGGMLALCFPPFDVPLMPVALALLLWLLRGASTRQAFFIGMSGGTVFFGLTLRWLAAMFGAAAVTLWALSALFPAAACVLFVVLRRRFPKLPCWLLFPVCWTATEYFRSELMIPNFAWMGLGYSLVNAPCLVAPASVIGSYGVTFLLCILGSVLFLLLERTERASRRWTNFAAPAGLLGLWLTLVYAPGPQAPLQNPLNVRLIQGASEQDDDMFRLSRTRNGFHPTVTVWPEDSYVNDPHRTPHLWEKLTLLSTELHGYFLFGARDQLDPRNDDVFQKTAYLIGPDGSLAGKHFKNHTVHFFKEGIPSREAHPIPTAFGRTGVAICFDMDYPDVARRLVSEGAETLLAPSDNPLEWGTLQHLQHKQLFQMRAVECDRWVATTDVAGNTFAVAPTGRIVRALTTTEPALLDVTIDRRTSTTLFIRGGWRFGPACLVVLAALCLAAFAPRRSAAKG